MIRNELLFLQQYSEQSNLELFISSWEVLLHVSLKFKVVRRSIMTCILFICFYLSLWNLLPFFLSYYETSSKYLRYYSKTWIFPTPTKPSFSFNPSKTRIRKVNILQNSLILKNQKVFLLHQIQNKKELLIYLCSYFFFFSAIIIKHLIYKHTFLLNHKKNGSFILRNMLIIPTNKNPNLKILPLIDWSQEQSYFLLSCRQSLPGTVW